MSRARLTIAFVVFLTLSVAALVSAGVTHATAVGPPHAIPTCRRLAGSAVVHRSPSVVVYRTAIRGDGGVHDWACPAHPRSRFIAATGLGTGPGGGFLAHAITTGFVSRGVWLVAVTSSSRGWSSCPAGTPARFCHHVRHEVELTDTRGSGGATATPADTAHPELHLEVLRRRHGYDAAVVVWTQPARHGLVTLRTMATRVGRGTGTVVLTPSLTGRINPASVTLHGGVVRFTEGGRRRVLRLAGALTAE